jgi:16S rRNA (guanine966-N2)-methyltransferase
VRIIAGRWRGRRLGPLRGRSVRPTTDRVREAWMSALGGSLDDLRVLDLFAGSGALGLEALSRGAREAVFVDKAPSSLRVLGDNVRLLGAESQSRIVKADALKYVAGLQPFEFDVALADPPYGEEYAARLLAMFRERPFAHELWVEHRSGEPIPEYVGLRQRRYGDTTLSTLTATVAE